MPRKSNLQKDFYTPRQIIGWPHGRVHEHVEIGEIERTIHCSWQALLMEVALAIDERGDHALTA